MHWVNSIKEFVPANEQEQKDKETVLKYIAMFDDILKRENELVHLTSSGFVVNQNRDKVLMVKHNIFNAWSLPGGHADGEKNLPGVAMREIAEETGVKSIFPVIDRIISLDILPVLGHMRKGVYVTAHLHLSMMYLFEGDENEQVISQPEENSDVRWIPIAQMDNYSSEPHMKMVYNKAKGTLGALGFIEN